MWYPLQLWFVLPALHQPAATPLVSIRADAVNEHAQQNEREALSWEEGFSTRLCDSLRALVDNAENRFAKLKGKAGDKDESTGKIDWWASKSKLPGAKECVVYSGDSHPYVDCTMYEGTDKAALLSAYASTAKNVAGCLPGPGWTARKRTKDTSRALLRSTDFLQDTVELLPYVSVTASEKKKTGSTHSVSVYISLGDRAK
jgi:hypothetical protein